VSYDPRVELLAANPSTGALDTLVDLLEVWKKVTLANDVSTDQTALQDLAALGFQPVANKSYLVDATLLMRSASALVGPSLSWAGPTGLADAACVIEGPTAATVHTARAVTGMPGTAFVLATLPTANESYIVRLRGIVRVGGSPGVGTIRPQFASTLLATTVTCKAGSLVLYRVI